MAPERSSASAARSQQADFVQAFQELAKGERTATALEQQLASMEAKIDALLAEAEKQQQEVTETARGTESNKTASDDSRNSA